MARGTNHGIKHSTFAATFNTNTAKSVFSLFKLSLVGSFDQVSVKHLTLFSEFEYWFNPCPAMLRREFPKVVGAAGVRLIKVHGTRHTAATLLLQAAVPVPVVAQRLGHADVTETLNTYAHALPDMQRDAAAKLGVLLTGR